MGHFSIKPVVKWRLHAH